MTGTTYIARQSQRRLAMAVTICAIAAGLGGCVSGNTYGTGVNPGMQTLQDLTGIVTGAGKNDGPIDYSPRAKLVAPPTTAQLPPPGDEKAQQPANWPNDPDEVRAKVLAEADARNATGAPLPANVIAAAKGRAVPTDDRDGHPLTPEEVAKVKKMFAAAKGSVAVDANGNPVRRYLTDPPNDYRVPDPSAPVDPAAVADNSKSAKKPFKWWWQQ